MQQAMLRGYSKLIQSFLISLFGFLQRKSMLFWWFVSTWGHDGVIHVSIEWMFRGILRVQDSQAEEHPTISWWEFFTSQPHGILRTPQGLLNDETSCHFTCPLRHLSWLLLWNQIWTLPSRVEEPPKHGLTISSTLGHFPVVVFHLEQV